MKIGVSGTGQFARTLLALWQLHPDVEELVFPQKVDQPGLLDLSDDRLDLLDADRHGYRGVDASAGAEGLQHERAVAPALRHLADDFVRAVTTTTHPPVSAWLAARCTLPGVVADDSAREGGPRLSIPAFGDGPGDPGWD